MPVDKGRRLELAEEFVEAWLSSLPELKPGDQEACSRVSEAELLAFGTLDPERVDNAMQHAEECGAFRRELVHSSEIAATAQGLVAVAPLLGAHCRTLAR